MVRPGHGEVFRVLDSLASADDGLGSLAALASVLDATDGVCDVSAELRAVAERTVDRSEAALFTGYVSPESASKADASAMAGRMLRAHRERDLESMVEVANLNPRLFSERPYVGVLTLAPVLSYEIRRDSGQIPVSEQVSEFFDQAPIPVAGAEHLLTLVLGATAGHRITLFDDEGVMAVEGVEMLVGLRGQMLDNRPLVDRFLEWALGLAAEMQRMKVSRSLDQCGATFTERFAPMACTLSALVSEDPATRRFRHVDVPLGSAYGDWRRWLELVSPKGFVHRTLGAFTPDDLVTAAEAVQFKGEIVRLVNAIGAAGSRSGAPEELRMWSIARRQEWLVDMSRLLVGDLEVVKILDKFGRDLPTAVPLGPGGPSVVAQEIVLWLAVDAEFREYEADGETISGLDPEGFSGLDPEGRAAFHVVVGERLAARLEHALADGDLAIDELRGLEGWVGLAAEMAAAGIRRPGPDFDPFVVGDDLGRWIAQLGGWLKVRGWKKPKERPEIEEIPELEPLVVPSSVDTGIGSEVEEAEDLEPGSPVVIVYVGGNERQARIQQNVDDHVRARYGNLVTVEWVHIDWGPNWTKDADRIDGLMTAGADAVVLLPLVRTGMGERVRRSSGEHGVPWIPCTGRGQTSAKRAIDEAVQVVCRGRLAA